MTAAHPGLGPLGAAASVLLLGLPLLLLLVVRGRHDVLHVDGHGLGRGEALALGLQDTEQRFSNGGNACPEGYFRLLQVSTQTIYKIKLDKRMSRKWTNVKTVDTGER